MLKLPRACTYNGSDLTTPSPDLNHFYPWCAREPPLTYILGRTFAWVFRQHQHEKTRPQTRVFFQLTSRLDFLSRTCWKTGLSSSHNSPLVLANTEADLGLLYMSARCPKHGLILSVGSYTCTVAPDNNTRDVVHKRKESVQLAPK